MEGDWSQSNTADPDNNYLYNGKELDQDFGLDWYHYGARMYDPTIGVFTGTDRFAENYAAQSPYTYAANNPIKFIDVNGDSISLLYAQITDKSMKTDYTNQITSQLGNLTGLSLSVNSRGLLEYKKDSDGNPVINTSEGQDIGSKSARNYLVEQIGGEETTSVSIRPGGRSVTEAGGLSIGLDPLQINNFVKGTPEDLNPLTLGLGMTLLHELHHSGPGGNLRDVADKTNVTATGDVVDQVNVFRSELDKNPTTNGGKFGQRLHYNANGGAVNFRFNHTNKKGKNRKRTRAIKF